MNDNKNILVKEWDAFISENIRGAKTQIAVKTYVNKLISNNTVVILDFNHLALLLGIEVDVLARITSHSESFYYDFEIPKRDGKSRNISAPYPVLLQSQRWIYKNILSKQPIHDCSKGFKKNTSIVDNAKVHLNQKILLKMDIEDFFPSIKLNRVISVFRVLGYTKKISYYLASICCYKGALPQGGVTSPSLSNIITKRLDYRLNGLASKFDLKYTRYADDFTFSGEYLPIKIIDYIKSIVSNEGFKIKDSKTKMIGSKRQKIVTGISISSGKMTIPRKTKRELRKNVHYLLKNGLSKHLEHNRINDPIYTERMIGYLHFWHSVEPNNKYVKESLKKLKDYSIQLDS
ncbi:RNA-directed DNA polymerase [Xanthomarina gelatinilytica]|uniref:RNA-directed DNA polymerase n=1 Tax=Xanthomarina gelatinilytica TaxID=1137281 RepID=M7MZS7_9FLAO|nr:retron St85 family RNA-directed DNA polymerase [Xanthomarina gelatinilytica]EMQ95004.1 RNA-directed DNA polymerase [Xanthomarina gelatinilytica]